MKLATATNAIEILNKSQKSYMDLYIEKLPALFEMQAEAELQNGNFYRDMSSDLEDEIQTYEFLIKDLITLRRAITKHQDSVRLYCTYYKMNNIFKVISFILENVGIITSIEGDELVLTPAEELKKEAIKTSQPLTMYEQENYAVVAN